MVRAWRFYPGRNACEAGRLRGVEPACEPVRFRRFGTGRTGASGSRAMPSSTNIATEAAAATGKPLSLPDRDSAANHAAAGSRQLGPYRLGWSVARGGMSLGV